MLAAMAFLFGLVVGSFLNVVILRHGEKSVGGRSACPHCGAQLRWYDMIPVLSWLALRGRCRDCRASISIQYPLVELATAILFALFAGSPLQLQPLPLALSLAAAALLICIFAYDLYHTIIPDPWVWSFCALSLLLALIARGPEVPLWLALAAGFVAALPLFALWAMSRGRWMGFGDVKLSLGVGWLLGFPAGFFAVMFSFVIGAIVSVCVLLPLPWYARQLARFTPTLASKNAGPGFTMKSEVPFGPFIVASTILVWLALMYGAALPLSNLYGS